MKPIILLCGFLGGGKTTFLSNIAKKYPQNKFAFIINEFSKFDVDAQYLNLENSISISGGNIFCNCKVEHFIEAIEVLNNLDCDAIIVETSGISDPNSAWKLLEIFKSKANDLQIARCICIVDSTNFEKLYNTISIIKAQIKASDTILLNKIDLVSKAKIIKLKSIINELNADANIIETLYCHADINLGKNIGFIGEKQNFSASSNLKTITLKFDNHIDKQNLLDFIKSNKDKFLRVKGFFKSNNQTFKLDFNGNDCNLELVDDIFECTMVFIFKQDFENICREIISKYNEK